MADAAKPYPAVDRQQWSSGSRAAWQQVFTLITPEIACMSVGWGEGGGIQPGRFPAQHPRPSWGRQHVTLLLVKPGRLLALCRRLCGRCGDQTRWDPSCRINV